MHCTSCNTDQAEVWRENGAPGSWNCIGCGLGLDLASVLDASDQPSGTESSAHHERLRGAVLRISNYASDLRDAVERVRVAHQDEWRTLSGELNQAILDAITVAGRDVID